MSQKESGWEKEFEKRFIGYEKVSGGIGLSYVTDVDNPYLKNDISGIKDFIQETLSNREKEIAEEVEKMKKICRTCKKPLDETARDYDGVANCQCCEHEKVAYEHSTEEIGYNQAITDVLQIMKH